MKKLFFLAVVVSTSVFFAGCTDKEPAVVNTQQKTTEKVGDTTKTGVISFSAGRYFLAEAGQTPREIESYSVELGDYVGKTVTVTGQYSGDTLFVGSIE